MKTLKIVFLLGAISLFTSIPYGAVEARDCSNPKGFHEKMMCKLGSEHFDPKKNPKKTDGESFFEKIKKFGGTKVGESDN